MSFFNLIVSARKQAIRNRDNYTGVNAIFESKTTRDYLKQRRESLKRKRQAALLPAQEKLAKYKTQSEIRKLQKQEQKFRKEPAKEVVRRIAEPIQATATGLSNLGKSIRVAEKVPGMRRGLFSRDRYASQTASEPNRNPFTFGR